MTSMSSGLDPPRLVNLLQVERFRKVRVPHLHDQWPVQIEELIPLPVVVGARVGRFEVVVPREVRVDDGFVCADGAYLVGLQEGVSRVGMRVLERVGHGRGDVLTRVLSNEVVSSRVIIDEGSDLCEFKTPHTREKSASDV